MGLGGNAAEARPGKDTLVDLKERTGSVYVVEKGPKVKARVARHLRTEGRGLNN